MSSPPERVNFMDSYGPLVEDHHEMEINFSFPVARPLKLSLDDKLFRALRIYQECFSGAENILAQVWVPMRCGDHQVLNTSYQPFLTDQKLSGYREVSRSFIFATERKEGPFLGLPGRVFMSKAPEWTPNVSYYSETEFLRLGHAADHKVRGSIAMPVFDEGSIDDKFCCAVFELVTTVEKADFNEEMDNICHVLQAVDLSSNVPPVLHTQYLSKNQKVALPELKDILHNICRAYILPLALTWIPCIRTEINDKIQIRTRGHSVIIDPNEKYGLCVEESACYWDKQHMYGFVHACAGIFLETGQGVAGRAFQSNQSFFNPNVKEYHVSEYPLVHHARKSGLNSGFAMRLRNHHYDDYILEFFLPVNMKDGNEQEIMIRNISNVVHRISMSSSETLDRELYGELFSRDGSGKSDDLKCVEREAKKELLKLHEQKAESSRRTKEKHVSLSDMKPHFSEKISEAAEHIGVCSTTLKRKCRQQGITRWPSRKMKMVDQSSKKIEDVIVSVTELEEKLKFYPTTKVGPVVNKVSRAMSKIQNVIGSVRKMIEEMNSNPTTKSVVAPSCTNQEFDSNKDCLEEHNTLC